ncbi:MAG: ribosome silencing factor [Chthoniobacterales bacterium]|nr:ribosome silencing factor [Chthoniobacterales bacterium]
MSTPTVSEIPLSGEAAAIPDSQTFAILAARAVDRKKAEDILVLDLRGISSFTDFFVICSGSSDPQLKAIVEALRELADENCRRILGEDGFPASQWVVVDFGDVIVHVFHQLRRGFYDLESLWRDAPRVAWS